MSSDSPEQRALRITAFDADDGHRIRTLGTFKPQHQGCRRLPPHIERPAIIVGGLKKKNGEYVMLGQSILVSDVDVTVTEGVRLGHYVTSLREMKPELVDRYPDDVQAEVKGKSMKCAEWRID